MPPSVVPIIEATREAEVVPVTNVDTTVLAALSRAREVTSRAEADGPCTDGAGDGAVSKVPVIARLFSLLN
jgi:hypothetical protein